MTLAPTLPIEQSTAGGAQRPAHRSVSHRIDAAPTEGTCLVCSGSAPQPDGCCSPACAHLAHLELQATSRRLQDRSGGAGSESASGVDHRRLAERAGRLSSALLRWRATVDPGRCSGLATPLRHRSVPAAGNRR